jgi:23S rRNA (adenine2503-C2)-methyltransferase
MAINETNNLDTLVEAMNYFYDKTGNRISFEYILFEGFNDSVNDAKSLISLCKRVPARVNIIEYNPVAGVPYTKSRRIGQFLLQLEQGNVSVTVRRSRGKDIDAACGQLANKG